MATPKQVQEVYAQSTGTERYYRHPFGGVVTDGVKGVAETAGAFWLVDAILSHRRTEPFQVWTLTVEESMTTPGARYAALTMREDSGKPVRVYQKIESTDFPMGAWAIWGVRNPGEPYVLLLPTEY